MATFLNGLFSDGPFIPHGHCYLWKPGLVWLHILSDAWIAFAYYAIPFILLYFVRKRQDTPFSWVFGLFITFILACGTTHLINIWTLWHPTYWVAGIIKATTAGVSVFTAIALFPIAPKAIAMPSTKQLEVMNQTLQQEIYDRQQAQAQVQTLNAELEQRIQERTAELKQINQELTQEKERLRWILQNMPVMLDTFDEQGNISIWNQECERVTGYSAEEIVGNPEAMTLLYPDKEYRQAMIRSWHERGNRYRNWEWKLTHKDGHTKVIAWSNISDDFPVPGWSSWGVGLDVSDLRQAELRICQLNEALEAQNRNLEALVEQRTTELLTFISTLPDYIFVVERDTSCITFCNDRLAETTGVTSRFEVQGKNIFDCFPANHATYFREQNRRVFETGETLHVQETLDLPTGVLYLDTYKIPLKHPNGETYALIGSSRNISELVQVRQALTKRSEELHQINQQLEATNQELESFSYSVSHDLRAPLRHINGFIAALTKRLAEQHNLHDQTVSHYLHVIADSSQRMGQLIDGLLTLSRVGRRQMQHRPVQLTQLAEQAINLVQSTEAEGSVMFELAELPVVRGDRILLQQVFTNLIDNAVKFSRWCQPAHIHVGSTPDGAVFIKDNGVGFDRTYAEQLFGVFQRLHSREQFEGTGIGLAIVQRIVHRHGGTIWAESQPNQGACFYFKLNSEGTVN